MAKSGTEGNAQLEDLLAKHTLDVRALVEQLRGIVLNTIPQATEAVYLGWHGLGYRHPESGYFCGIFPQKEQVNLGIEFGILLTDPDALLEGQGKQLRYVYIKPGHKLNEDAVKRLLLEAVNLPWDRKTKQQMIDDIQAS